VIGARTLRLVTDHRMVPATPSPLALSTTWRYSLHSKDVEFPCTGSRGSLNSPDIRWRQFLADCHRFVSSSENWAERATELGWNDLTLFGCRRARPLDHLASAGLLWAINGGTLVELHRDWAVIERAEDGSRRIHHRRPLNAANVALPLSGPHGVRQRRWLCRQLGGLIKLQGRRTTPLP
jgi:hypothetical protein